MDINCPYCGTRYELDDSLLPEGDIKVKCRICSNVFILNKNTGAFKEGIEDNESSRGISGGEARVNPVSDDFMRSIMSEINSAVAEETGKSDKAGKSGEHKKDSGADHNGFASSGKGKSTPFQIAMLIVLIVLFLIAAASALVHYNIINIPFLPSGAASFLSSL
jgi:predicted Zn finger-like uncharacterized protein